MASVLLAGCLLAGPAIAAEPFSGNLSVTLEGGAIARRQGATGTPKSITLDLTAANGAWQQVWGYGDSFNRMDHRGSVKVADVTATGIHLQVEMRIQGDAYVPGGLASYAIDLARSGDGKLAGTYGGEFRSATDVWKVSGKATGEAAPSRTAPAGFIPIAPGEHPRLLFRKADLPALRARMRTTDVGKACYARIVAGAGQEAKDDGSKQQKLVALAMLHQLDGEQRYADEAMPLVEDLMRVGYHNGANALPEPWGWNISSIALAYDLCYDAWPEPFRRKMTAHLLQIAERLVLHPEAICSKMNKAPGSNYQPGTRGGAGIAMLAIWGEQGEAPVAPRNPGVEPQHIAAPQGFTPGNGVPVVTLAPGLMPTQWLFAGPFLPEGAGNVDCLATLGGSAQARPAEGTKVACGGANLAFQPLDAKCIWNDPKFTEGQNALDLTKAVNRIFYSKAYFYTVLNNDASRVLRVRFSNPSATPPVWPDENGQSMWIAGTRCYDGDFVRLDKGRYPVLLDMPIGRTDPWGTIWSMPRLDTATEEQAKSALAKQQTEYRARLAEWQEDSAAWKQSGGTDQQIERIAAIGRRAMARYFQYMMGDGGWQCEGEGYTLWSSPLALEYAHCYHTMYGMNPTPRPDVSHFAARYVMQTIFSTEQRRTFSQSYGNGDGTMSVNHYARVFSATADAYKPAVLWAWNYMMGLGVTPALPAEATPGVGDARTAIYTLINYPTDMAAKNPGSVLPHAFAAAGRGGYIFRNNWQGTDDIVAQIFLKTMPPTGWNQPNAGSIRIYGLGHPWAIAGAENPKTGERMCENVVWLPTDPVQDGLGVAPTAYQAKPDGSGVIAMDMTPLYSGRKTTIGGDGNSVELPTAADFVYLKENLADLGITGMRSFAADYSGTSGAPALFALVDSIRGGHDKVWMWQLPDAHAGAQVTIEGNSFTIAQDDATLRATFITPADVTLTVERGTKEVRTVLSSKDMTWGMKKVQLNAMHATGGDDFFVILTLQRGPAPAVTIEGTGLNARVHVGGQTITFDGKQLVLAK